MVEKQDGVSCGLDIWIRLGTRWVGKGGVVNTVIIFAFDKMMGISCEAEQQLACQEGLSFIELIS
jgi:hypothetical protein